MLTAPLDPAHARYLGDHARGLLATVAPNGTPQNKPVGFRYDPALGTIDIAGFAMERSAKFRNVGMNPDVAFTVEDAPDPAAGADGVRFVELRGTAERIELGAPTGDGSSQWILRIHPRRLVSWNVAGTGMFTADLPTGGATARPHAAAASDRARPTLGVGGADAEAGRRAVARQVAELQAGLGDRDLQPPLRR